MLKAGVGKDLLQRTQVTYSGGRRTNAYIVVAPLVSYSIKLFQR